MTPDPPPTPAPDARPGPGGDQDPIETASDRARKLIAALDAEGCGKVLHGALKAVIIAHANDLDREREAVVGDPIEALEAYLKAHAELIPHAHDLSIMSTFGGALITVGDIRAAVAALRAQDATIAILREKLERADYALKEASSLYPLGFNELHAEGCPGGVDSTGTSSRKYRGVARKLLKLIAKTREEIR